MATYCMTPLYEMFRIHQSTEKVGEWSPRVGGNKKFEGRRLKGTEFLSECGMCSKIACGDGCIPL